MFNPDFYPTPDHVIQQMIGTIDVNGKTILEPSAGKGNIVEYLNSLGAKVLTCETNEVFASHLSSKSTFLSSDFFNVGSEHVSHIDMIIMNPPFSNADKHILHAWEIAPEGCQIIALCNNETIRNQFSRTRSQVGQIVREYGTSENLGNVFTDAERTTEVEVALINLWKPSIGENEFDGYFDLTEDQEQQENGIIKHDHIREIVNRFVGAVKMFDSVQDAANQINQTASIFDQYSPVKFAAFKRDGSSVVTVNRDEYKKALQKAAWLKVFSMFNMEKYLTKSLQEEINKFVEKQTHVPFTMKNVYKMIEMVAGTHNSRMDKAIIEAFDKITKHYHENRYAVEGWKTNDSYIVNKKIILPYVTSLKYGGGIEISYRGNGEMMDDLTKALCHITGENYSNFETLSSWSRGTKRPLEWYLNNEELRRSKENEYDHFQRNNPSMSIEKDDYVTTQLTRLFNDNKYPEQRWFGEWYDWGFFKVKGFKKGTMHFEFKDKKVWEEFNKRVAKIKGNVLPEKF